VSQVALFEDQTDPGTTLVWTHADQDNERQALEILAEHYPGWSWRVESKSAGGIMTVRNENLATRHGVVVHLSDVATLADMRSHMVNAGGEFLERYGMPRGRFDPDRWLAWFTAVGGKLGTPPAGVA
jgi:hypothetical protein